MISLTTSTTSWATSIGLVDHVAQVGGDLGETVALLPEGAGPGVGVAA